MEQSATVYKGPPLVKQPNVLLLFPDTCETPSNAVNFPLNNRTFYSVLRESGYRVGGAGKFDLHKPSHWWGLNGWIEDLETLGFRDGIDNAGKIDAVVSGKDGPKDPYMKYLYDHGLAELHIADMNGRKGGGTDHTLLHEEAYCDNWLTNNGINILRSFPRDQPWFLAGTENLYWGRAPAWTRM